jgi:hypothetical protein
MLTSTVLASKKKTKKKVSVYRKPHDLRGMIFRHLYDDKDHELEVIKDQAPHLYRKRFVAGRSFKDKKFHVWFLKNNYVPLSYNVMRSYVEFVEKFFVTEFQFPMLINMLSMRLDVIHINDVLEAIEVLTGKHVPSLHSQANR